MKGGTQPFSAQVATPPGEIPGTLLEAGDQRHPLCPPYGTKENFQGIRGQESHGGGHGEFPTSGEGERECGLGGSGKPCS